jgi:hypothetical protein
MLLDDFVLDGGEQWLLGLWLEVVVGTLLFL